MSDISLSSKSSAATNSVFSSCNMKTFIIKLLYFTTTTTTTIIIIIIITNEHCYVNDTATLYIV